MDIREKIIEQIKARAKARVKDLVLSRRDRLRLAVAGDTEKVDPVPHELLGVSPPLSLRAQIQQFIRSELSAQAQAQGQGSFEDEDDFSEEDPEADLLSRYDVRNLVPEVPETLDGAAPDDAPPSPLG